MTGENGSLDAEKFLMKPEEDGQKAVFSAGMLLVVTGLLAAFGLTMLYSTSYGLVGIKYFKMQLIWLLLGMTSGITVFLFGYRRVAGWWPVMWWGVMILLGAALCSKEINGAHRWINIAIPGLGKVGIQPSEFAKVVLALTVSKYCADHLRTFAQLRRKWGGLLQLALYALPVIFGILAGKDLGTTVLVSAMVLLILLAAGLPVRWGVMALGLIPLGYFYIMRCDPMRRARILSFLDPELYADTIGYQLWNSFLALGTGGWHGSGFMGSRLKALYLPEAHTDFILSIVGEELGLIGLVLVMIAYGFFCYAGVQISIHAADRLGMLLGFGLTMYITLQATINIAVISGCFPTKGMPAPFISYGGSNMLTCMTAVGLLLSIAKDSAPDCGEHLKSYFGLKEVFARHDSTHGE